MTRIQPEDLEEAPDNFQSLTAEEARNLRKRLPLLSVWRVVGAQVFVGMVLALLVWLVTGQKTVVFSAVYGALAVILPAALFARGLTSQVSSVNAGAAVFGFFLWEMVKMGLTIAMLFAAPRLVNDLSWPAMLVGLVVTMKVYWLALGLRRVFYPVASI
jgi:ATP synthase protein I